jgi:uncharacterized membrane protein
MTELSIFAPFSNRDFCLWFYFLSIVGFVFLFAAVLSAVFIGISKKKDISFYIQMFFLALGYGIFYFQNRLLYSMCAKSI